MQPLSLSLSLSQAGVTLTLLMNMLVLLLFFSLTLVFSDAEEHAVNELYSLIGSPQSGVSDATHNQTKNKDPLPTNELGNQDKKSTDPKFLPLPAGLWPKHTDPLATNSRPAKGKKGSRDERLPVEHNDEKIRNKVIPAIVTGVVNHTQPQKATPEVQSNNPLTGHSEIYQNSRSRTRQQVSSSSTHRENGNGRMDPEENRPGGKWSLNSSRPFSSNNRRSSSLLFYFDIQKKESDFNHDAVCLSECRKEKDETENLCSSEFAINGIVHDIDIVRQGIRLVTLLVSSDGFYKMGRLYVSPDTFFFKVNLLVLDTFKCSKPCPDLKLGSRYIIMGQIYHRRRHLPVSLVALVGGSLKPGDGVLRSNNYIKRFNKRRHQKAQEAMRSRCR